MSRLFVAVWPSEAVVEALRRLPRDAQPGVRWVRPEQWHVTVRFLGEADEEVAAAALGRVRAPVAEAVVGPRVSRLGRNVVCVPVAGLDRVAAAVAEATASVGDPPDPRPFAGHITIARLGHRAACGVTGQAVSGRFPVTAVELVRSRTDRHGATYETVRRFDLGT